MRLELLKTIDKVAGPLAVRLLKKPASSQLSSPNSILFVRPGGIGDAVLLIPAIQAVKKAFPDAGIDILAEKRNCGAFSLCPGVRDLFLYDRPKELWRAIRNKYDLVIDTEQWHRMSAVVARLTKAPVIIGYATNERGKMFTHQVMYSHDDYEAESFLHLIGPVAGKAGYEHGKPFLSVSRELTDKARASLAQLSGQDMIVLFPGGSIPEKRWGADKFHQLALLLSGKGYGIAVVGSKDDMADGAAVLEGVTVAVNLCGSLSLQETAAVLKEASLLITGDSGIMHLGHGLGVRTLALFGPGIERKWAPMGRDCTIINKHLDCSPCTKFGHTPRCRKNTECMNLITVEEVYGKAIELLQ